MKYLIRTMIVSFFICNLLPITINAKECVNVLTLDFVNELEQLTKSPLVAEDTYKDNTPLKRVDAAVLLDKAYCLMYDDKYDESIYEKVVSKNRITDLNKVSNEKQSAVLRCFVRGLMKGYSPGKCHQERVFKGNNYITSDEAQECINRLKKNSIRVQLSQDGQVIRTTNLPKNAKDFPYILEAFPNDFYEMAFQFNFFDCSTQKMIENSSIDEILNSKSYKEWEGNPGWYKSKKDPYGNGTYTTPAKVNQMANGIYCSSFTDPIEYPFRFTAFINMREMYEEGWCQMIEDYLELRYSVNYKDSKWVNAFMKSHGNSEKVKDYIKDIKKNKVVIECNQVTVEPSTIYDSEGICIRTYVKFQVKSAVSLKDLNKVFYKDYIGSAPIKYNSLEKGKWKEIYVDYKVMLGVIRLGEGHVPIEDYVVCGNSTEDTVMENRMKGPISDYKVEKVKTGRYKGYYQWALK